MRFWQALVLVAGLASPSAAMAEVLPLARGVGLNEWLNWSPLEPDGSYRWPPYRSVEEWLGRYRPASDWPAGDPFVAIRKLGFDFVRLTVDPGPLLDSHDQRRREALQVLAADVRKVTDAGLKVVVNLHGNDQVPKYGMDVVNAEAGSPGVAGYRQMVAELAASLLPIGVDKVAIEPFNEPAHYPCDTTGTEDWQEIMQSHVAAIRAVSAEMTIVATGACGGDVEGLIDVDPRFDDPNIYYSFHMYEPHLFTHQRALDEGGFASGLPWPADLGTAEAAIGALRERMTAAGLDDAAQLANLRSVRGLAEQYFDENWGAAQLEMRVGQALDWARAHGIPPHRLFMGEFGVIKMSADGRMGAADADRLRYLAAVRGIAEANGIPWAIWEYSNPWGMTVIAPSGPALPDRPLLSALGLDQ